MVPTVLQYFIYSLSFLRIHLSQIHYILSFLQFSPSGNNYFFPNPLVKPLIKIYGLCLTSYISNLTPCFTVTSEYVYYWAVPARLPLWRISCNLAKSRLTPMHFIHVPHQTGSWYLLLSRLFHHMDCPVPATLDKGEKSCSLKPESHKS